MAHVLARLAGAAFGDVERQLQLDAATHAGWGMHLEHLWKNSDNAGEVLFLFRVDDLERCKQRMERVHAEARRQNPDARLPQLVFLDGDRGWPASLRKMNAPATGGRQSSSSLPAGLDR